VQVATRLLCAACPAFHWHLARLLLPRLLPRLRGRDTPRKGPGLLLLLWLGAYNVLGPLLHANAYPWT
jgi:hypothetical protein